MSKKNLLSLFIALIPVSLILGTFILNLNVLILIISGLVLFINGLRFKFDKIDILIVLFFIYILFSGFWNTIEINFIIENDNKNYYILNKSILFLRYLLLYFSIRLIVSNKLINFKLIFYSYSLITLFVSVDIIFQFFYIKDLFGLVSPFFYKIDTGETVIYKVTGPFYDEAIAGGFIQKFALFAFFSFFIFSKIKSVSAKVYISSTVFFIILISIIFSGNRMPLILFILNFFIIIIVNKKLRKYLLNIFISFLLISLITINLSTDLKRYYNEFYFQSAKIISLYSFRLTGIGSDLVYKERPFYIHEFDAGFSTFKLNKYIGGGVKSFRFNCPKRQIKNRERTTCNMHPHNYYIEILTDLGIFGFLIFLSLITLVLYKTYKVLIYSNSKYYFSPFFYIFLMEIFPLRSSGSFFTTNNAVLIFFTLGVIVSFLKYKNWRSHGESNPD